MKLTWMPPRSVKHENELYKQVRHWLVNEEGRILACIIEPAQDNPQDNFDTRLYHVDKNDTGYFISLDQAQAWCEKRCREIEQASKEVETNPATLGVVTEKT